jgi:hypothetical protein
MRRLFLCLVKLALFSKHFGLLSSKVCTFSVIRLVCRAFNLTTIYIRSNIYSQALNVIIKEKPNLIEERSTIIRSTIHFYGNVNH